MSEPIENAGHAGSESLLEKIQEKVHHYRGSSSSSDSDNEKPSLAPKKNRLFGRQQPVHTVLGGGKRNCVPTILPLWFNGFFNWKCFFCKLVLS